MKKNVFYFFLHLMSVSAFSSDFKLRGTYLLEYSFLKIDVYQISYYVADDAEKLVLDYKMSVKKIYSIEGWKEGLKHKLEEKAYQEKAQWLFDHTVDMAKDDQLVILKTSEALQIYKNDKLVGQTTEKMVRDLAFEPWLGERPVDVKLKEALLNLKESVEKFDKKNVQDESSNK